LAAKSWPHILNFDLQNNDAKVYLGLTANSPFFVLSHPWHFERRYALRQVVDFEAGGRIKTWEDFRMDEIKTNTIYVLNWHPHFELSLRGNGHCFPREFPSSSVHK
jgi:hypothetical protein